MMALYTWYAAVVAVIVGGIAGFWIAGDFLLFGMRNGSLSWSDGLASTILLCFPGAAAVAVLGARRQPLGRSTILSLLAITIVLVYSVGLYLFFTPAPMS